MSGPAIGIDLGTSNTAVAVVQGDTAHVIPDVKGNRIHPSVVSFHPKGVVLVGQEANRRRVIDPLNTITSIKRLIGRTFRSSAVKTVQKVAPYKISRGDNEQPVVVTRGVEYTIPEISAFILRHIKKIAENYLEQEVQNVVITVPANFNDAQREATKAAGQIAGLNVMRILNEPTAATLAYGYAQGKRSSLAIYDFGGGTFDITILQLDDRVFEVLSTAGDTFLGGDDVDDVLVQHMLDLFLQENRVDLRTNVGAMARLRSVAEQIKRQLSIRTNAVIQVQEIAYGPGGNALDINFTFTREELHSLALELVRRSFLICDEAFSLAGMAPSQLDEVVMVGGTTRMPLVQQMVKDYFGAQPHTDINPDEVVAVGAAIQAASLSRAPAFGEADAGAPDISAVLLDVTPRAVGIGVVGGYADTIIERNAPIPVEQTRVFSTSKDNQTQVRIKISQGESRVLDENQPLGELLLDNLRAAPRGEVKIEVTFEINTNGILKVRARDVETDQEQNATMQVLGTISEDQLEKLREKQENMPAPVDQAVD